MQQIRGRFLGGPNQARCFLCQLTTMLTEPPPTRSLKFETDRRGLRSNILFVDWVQGASMLLNRHEVSSQHHGIGLGEACRQVCQEIWFPQFRHRI